MSLNMRIFVGVDCNEEQLTMGFIGSQGILKGLSSTGSLFPDRLNSFGQCLVGMMRGLRGEENLRMKNFYGIGIGIPARYVPRLCHEIEKQIRQLLDIAVYIEDRDVLAAKGKLWIDDIAGMNPHINLQQLDLSVVYGAAKLAVDSVPPRIA